MPSKVAVLLSTYNGEQYLVPQLDSILTQTHQDFLIIVRDDGSTDLTRQVLERYQFTNPEKIKLLDHDRRNLGPGQSFATLVSYTLANKQQFGFERIYMAFCDQDDVWEKTKLQKSLDRLEKIQTESLIPALVHSDLRVVNENLQEIAASMATYQGLEPARKNFGRSLVANCVTGCTAMINEELARLSLPLPESAVMHDWWLALVASAMGETGFIAEPLVYYRQHAGNALGAKRMNSVSVKQMAFWGRLFSNQNEPVFRSIAAQTSDFHQRYAAQLTPYQIFLCRIACLLSIRVPIVQKLLFRLLRAI